jgi:hypothetical protein
VNVCSWLFVLRRSDSGLPRPGLLTVPGGGVTGGRRGDKPLTEMAISMIAVLCCDDQILN